MSIPLVGTVIPNVWKKIIQMFQTFPNHQPDKDIVTISCWWHLPCFMFQWTSHWSTGSSGYQNETIRGCTGQLRNMVKVFPLPVWPQRGWGGMLPYVALPPNIDIDSSSSGGLEDYIPLDSLQSSDSQDLCWLGGNITQLFPLQCLTEVKEKPAKTTGKPCWGCNHKQRWCCCSHQRPQHSWIQRGRGLHGETDPSTHWGFTCGVSMYPSIHLIDLYLIHPNPNLTSSNPI